MGYGWKRTQNNRKVLIEKPNVVALRLAFYKKRKELEERGLRFVYIDETWVDTSYTVKKCWQGDNTPGVIPPFNRGQRVIVVHAGSNTGFVPGALLTYKAKSRTGDYHSEMDGRNFTKWVEEMLIPNLDEPCAIVMDNASYHSMQADHFPTTNTRKADIQEWLRSHSIQFSADMLRPQLLQLARANRPPPNYTIDQLLQSCGHEVLRLPPYHPDFNAIELIWGQMKKIISHKNLTFRLDDVQQLIKATLADIGVERWRPACEHVEKHIASCQEKDHFTDKVIDALVIDLRDDSSSDDSADEI